MAESSSFAFESSLYELLTVLTTPLHAGEAQGGEGARCVLCRLVTRSVSRWLRGFLAEYVNDPATRETLRKSRGFCAPHTRQMETLGDPLAVAILYSDLARLTRERWQQSGGVNRSQGSLWRKRRAGGKQADAPSAPCPACLAQAEAQNRYVRALAAGLDKPAVWDALENNPGMCAPHIEQVCAQTGGESAHRLMEQEMGRLAELQAELEEIVRKNDYRFRGEAWGTEKDAWRRALDKLKRDAP